MSATNTITPERSWRLAFGERGNDRGHIPVLDGVRAVSILLVLAAHLVPLGPSSLVLNEMAARMGMSLFFTLSGFLIVRFLWADQRIGRFVVRRVARIVPLATVYTAVMALIITYDPASFLTTAGYVVNYTHNFVPGTGPLWSLCVEMQFYLLIALTVLLSGRRGLWLVPIAMIVVTMLRVEAGAILNIKTHLRVDEILAGGTIALALIHLGGTRGDGPRWMSHMIWPAGIAFALSSHPDTAAFGYLRPYLGALTVLILIVSPYSWLRSVLSWKVFAYIAAISYALYILHMGLASGWFADDDKITLYFVKRPITIALTFALAHLSTHTLERWGNEVGKRLNDRWFARPA